MNQFYHGEDPAAAGDAAIHLDFSWIATPSFLGLAMTNRGVHQQGGEADRGNPDGISVVFTLLG